MNINKDTAKAVNAAKTLIEYCARYENCAKCVFCAAKQNRCVINRPYDYALIFSPYEDKGAQDVKE